MLQFIDVSALVYYDRKLVENRLLSMINACVSHELRNPLNSIVAQNIQKSFIYEEMEKLLCSDLSEDNLKAQLFSLLDKLKEGKKV